MFATCASWAVVVGVLAVQSEPRVGERPMALLRAVAARAALHTGVVECSQLQATAKPSTRYYGTCRFSDDGVIWTNRGDDQGVMIRNEHGEPSQFAEQVPIHTLHRGDQLWQHRERSDEAKLMPGDGAFGPRDFRTLGMGPYPADRDLETVVWRDSGSLPSAREYAERRGADGVWEVTAQTDTGVLKWWIDENRGWSVVRAAKYVDGRLWAESRTALAQFDGTWFPACVQYFSAAYANGHEPNNVVTVHSAVFNRPDQPRRLTPADIGIVPHETIVYRCDESLRVVEDGIYDGTKYISVREAAERRRSAGEEARRHEAEKPLEIRVLSEWEAYTRAFISRYALDEAQTQSAQNILRTCQADAGQYLRAHEPEFRKLDEQETKARTGDPAKHAGPSPALDADRARLRKPLDDIFERQLKPRLDKLPTRKQRELAGPVTTQPKP